MSEIMLTAKEAAARIGKSEHALRTQRFHGRGPRWVKVDKRVFYKASEVEDWMEEQAKPEGQRAAERLALKT